MAMLTRVDARVVPRLARGLQRLTRPARRGHVSPLVVAAILSVLAVAAAVAFRVVEPVGSMRAGGGSTVRVGVSDGDWVPEYEATSASELRRLAGVPVAGTGPGATAPPDAGVVATAAGGIPIYALVSFTDYLSPEEITQLTASVDARALTTVVAYARVPLKNRQTELVRLAAQRLPEELRAAMGEVAERKSRDAATYRQLADEEKGKRLRALYRSSAVVAAAEAAAYRRGCACIYALVVKASPSVLLDLAGRPGVRVVDPAPEVTRLDLAVFAAPLPEQRDRVQPPPGTEADPGSDPASADDTPADDTGDDLSGTDVGPTDPATSARRPPPSDLHPVTPTSPSGLPSGR